MNFETRSSHVRIDLGGSLSNQSRASPSREKGKSKSLIEVFGTSGCLNVEVTLLKNRSKKMQGKCFKSKRVDFLLHADVRQDYTSLLMLTGVNVNTGHGNVSSGNMHVNSGTQIKSGASRFNTGKQHVNSGSVHVNSGTQIKSGASRFNTGKQHVSSGRVNRPVSNNTSPKPSQVNLNSPKKCFSKQRSLVNRPFSRNTAHKSNIYAVKGKMGTAVKTSAGCVWRKITPLSNTNSGPTPDSNVNVSRGSSTEIWEHRGIFGCGCSGHMTVKAHLERLSRTVKWDILLLEEVKVVIRGIKQKPHSDEANCGTECCLSEWKAKHRPPVKAKIERYVTTELHTLHIDYLDYLCNPYRRLLGYATDSNLPTTFWAQKKQSILLAIPSTGKELDALALKHLGPVPAPAPTSTNPVNTGSDNLNTGFEEVTSGNIEAISPSDDNEEEESLISLKMDSRVEAMQEELCSSSFQQVWVLVDLAMVLKMKGFIVYNSGFVDPDHPTKVYKVVKALYGLHQAPRACYATLSTFLEKHGYKRGTIDKTLFIRRNRKDIMLVQVYVDDIIFGSTNKFWCDEFEALMQSRFQLSSMGELTFFLGLQVTPKTSHLNAVKRIFKYLKGKPNLGLWYPRDSPLDLEAFSDSDYGGSNLDRKSTTGGCQFLGQRLISWQCKKQTIVATSTTEAEYVAAANCCGQVLWVQNQLLDYGFNFMNTKIHIDNESTICIVKNPVYHSKTKHIEIRHHFIRDCYEKKLISVEKIHTDLNVADLLTKPFDGPRYYLVFEKSDARSTWAWKRKCQVSLANWMQFGCQPQPSAAPTPSHPVPTPSSSHVHLTQPQSTPPSITQPPPTITQPVQSSSTPPQPSSVQPTFTTPPIQPVETTSSPPMFTIPDTQPTLPPSPQVPSPSYHDTEGPSFEPSYHMSPPPSHEPEFQAFRSSEENEQLRNLMDIVPRLQSRVESLEKELSETKQTLGTAILQLIEKVKKLENKLRKKRKSKEAKDAEGQDQEVPFETDQGDTFATPEKSKGSGEAQEEQISPSTLEAAQILSKVASEGFKGSQAPLGSKIYKRKPKSTKTPTKILHFEEPDSAQVNTAQVNTAELNPDSTPSAQVNTGEVNAAEVNTGEAERVQRRKGKEPMTEEDLQAEVQASKTSKELQELADLEEAQRLQAKMDAETQRQIDLDALLARRLVEQEEEAAQEALATEFDYIQARLNADQILAEKLQQEEREQYSIEDRAKFLHDTIAAQRKFLAEQRSAAIRNKPPTISQLRNQMITYFRLIKH
ncbi:putative ribonuclease H-like domain-containing protein [Tanacetum coccineum]